MSRIALLIVTPENQEAPWLLFEAGALSKNLERSKVCPLLFDGMQPTDIKGPLVQFQAAQFSAEEMKRVLNMVNAELGEHAVALGVLDRSFERWWPDLETAVQRQLGVDVQGRPPIRDQREVLEEILSLVRSLDGKRVEEQPPLPPPSSLPDIAVDDLSYKCLELAKIALTCAPADNSSKLVNGLYSSLRYIQSVTSPGKYSFLIDSRIEELGKLAPRSAMERTPLVVREPKADEPHADAES